MTKEPAFDRLRNDPRPIEGHLEKVIIATPDPREIVSAWRRVLANAGIGHRLNQVQYRYLLAQRPIAEGDAVFGAEDAEKYLKKENERWRAALGTVSGFRKKTKLPTPGRRARSTRRSGSGCSLSIRMRRRRSGWRAKTRSRGMGARPVRLLAGAGALGDAAMI
ncbi:uncharacterized protein PG986_012909 [Apiospora aurea]|uniref:Uncharacterized protein n=1 Tax=Apiospora aurea TaxID=335848 RepID=A0ABR1Q1C4_9PEZI